MKEATHSSDLKKTINKRKGEAELSQPHNTKREKKEALKRLIRSLHEGADPGRAKEEFREIIKTVTPAEIAKIEEELTSEGMPREEVHRLCAIHLAVFKESLEKEKALAPEGHPIRILMEEHKILLIMADQLKTTAEALFKAGESESASEEMKHLNHIVKHLRESESHYLREENVLFPYLEKHGITQPPAIMWMEHDKIRGQKKNLYSHVEDYEDTHSKNFAGELKRISLGLAEMLSDHFYKENSVLFPTALRVMGKEEWKDIRREFDELGYCCFTPESAKATHEEAGAGPPKTETEGFMSVETGNLTKDEIEAIFTTLPVDVTFVGKDDTVRYFSQTKDRIFVRSKAIIGRKVQQCHPQKSVHIVNRILQAFKDGTKDAAEFWLELQGKLIHIRYFAIRDRNRNYLGCLEVTQDITDIKKIEGQRRLLDWT